MPRRPRRKVFYPNKLKKKSVPQQQQVHIDHDYCKARSAVLQSRPQSPTASAEACLNYDHDYCEPIRDAVLQSRPESPTLEIEFISTPEACLVNECSSSRQPSDTSVQQALQLPEHHQDGEAIDHAESEATETDDSDTLQGDTSAPDTTSAPKACLNYDHDYCEPIRDAVLQSRPESPTLEIEFISIPEACLVNECSSSRQPFDTSVQQALQLPEHQQDGEAMDHVESEATETDDSDTLQGDTPAPDTTSAPKTHEVLRRFQGAADLLKGQIPPLWCPVLANDCLNILKLAPTASLVTQRSVAVSADGQVKYYVHGKPLSLDHDLYSSQSTISIGTVTDIVTSVKNIVSNFRLQDVCCGVTNLKFKKFWNRTENATVDHNPFQESRFRETIRSNNCSLVVQQTKRMCFHCLRLSKNLSKKGAAATPSQENIMKTPNKYKPFKYLVTPEKKARDKRKSKEIRNIRKQNARLRARIDVMIQEEGLDVSEQTEDDLKIIINSAVAQPQTTFMQKLFMEQQLKACSVKDRRSMRWHPLLIRLALRIRMLSRPAYDELIASGLAMPSDRTLYDYSHVIDVKPGICQAIIDDVAKRVDSMEHDYQHFHTLMFDEVHIKEKLVQNRHTGEVIGYANLIEVQQEFEEWEKVVTATAEGTQVAEKKTPVPAKRILSYLVKGTASSVSSVVASYPVSTLTKEDLMEYTWEVTEALEVRDIRVVAFISDGSAVNRGFYEMHPQADDSESDHTESDTEEGEEECNIGPSPVVFKTVNIYAPDRVIFFFSDLPHLVKTMRNCLYNSGKKRSRHMQKNGEYLTWAPILALFYEKKDQTLKKLHKLTAACVILNSYSRMNCLYAFRVFSGSVSSVILDQKVPGTRELGIFEEN